MSGRRRAGSTQGGSAGSTQAGWAGGTQAGRGGARLPQARRQPGGLLGDLSETYGLGGLDSMAPEEMRGAADQLGVSTAGMREMLDILGAVLSGDLEELSRIGEEKRRRLAEEMELTASIMSEVPGFERIIERCRAAKAAQTEALATSLADLMAEISTAAAEAEAIGGELAAYADLVAADDEQELGDEETGDEDTANAAASTGESEGDDSGDGENGGDQDGDGGDGGSGDGGDA